MTAVAVDGRASMEMLENAIQAGMDCLSAKPTRCVHYAVPDALQLKETAGALLHKTAFMQWPATSNRASCRVF